MSFSEVYTSLPQYRAIVLEGGGPKGLAYWGLLMGLEKYDILSKIVTFAGSSIGALFALLLCLGYTAKEVGELIVEKDFRDLAPMSKWWCMRGLNVAWNMGMVDSSVLGDFVRSLMSKKLKRKDVSTITFADLKNWTKRRLLVTSTNLNRCRVTYFSHDTTPDFPVHLAVTMSMTFPGVFQPIKHDGDYWMDGGIGDNFPIKEVLKYHSRDRILGVKLITNQETVHSDQTIYDGRKEIDSLAGLCVGIVESMQVARENCDLTPDFWTHTIALRVEDTSMLQTEYTKQDKEKFCKKGLKDTIHFLESKGFSITMT